MWNGASPSQCHKNYCGYWIWRCRCLWRSASLILHVLSIIISSVNFSQCLTICGSWPHFCLPRPFSCLDEVDLVSPRLLWISTNGSCANRLNLLENRWKPKRYPCEFQKKLVKYSRVKPLVSRRILWISTIGPCGNHPNLFEHHWNFQRYPFESHKKLMKY